MSGETVASTVEEEMQQKIILEQREAQLPFEFFGLLPYEQYILGILANEQEPNAPQSIFDNLVLQYAYYAFKHKLANKNEGEDDLLKKWKAQYNIDVASLKMEMQKKKKGFYSERHLAFWYNKNQHLNIPSYATVKKALDEFVSVGWLGKRTSGKRRTFYYMPEKVKYFVGLQIVKKIAREKFNNAKDNHEKREQIELIADAEEKEKELYGKR